MPPRQPLDRDLDTLTDDIIKTLTAGLQRSRPDLSYPESYSDMTWAVQGLLEMFEVKYRTLPLRIKWTHEEPRYCSSCRVVTRDEYGYCSGCGSTIIGRPFKERPQ